MAKGPSKSRSQTSDRRYLKRAEAMALDPKVIKREGPGAFFFMMGPTIAPNERAGADGSVAVVNVRGALEQFDDCTSDSYEAICARVESAMLGTDDEEEERSAPSCVVLRISSPGGVVAGLWETVSKLRAMSEAHGIRLLAYVDEMAASAAYALACACDTIVLPNAGQVGSIGVISHMLSVARMNEEDGVDVAVITSGDQKADGNENLPISDAALSREQARVDRLARQFFRVVAGARSMPANTIRDLQAGLFLGKDGVRAGLADAVMGWDAFLGEIALAYGGSAVTPLAQPGTLKREDNMMRLDALIARTKKDLAAAKGAARKALADRLARLEATAKDLASFKKTTWEKETSESEEAPEEEESEDEEKDEDAEDADDAKSEDADEDAEGDEDKKESRRSEDDEADDEAESEDADEDAEGDEDSKKALVSALTGHLKGNARQQARGALAALIDKANAFDKLQPTVAQLKATETKRARDNMIDAALKGRRITKAHAKMLRGKKLAFVKDFLAMHQKPLYFTADDAPLTGEGGIDATAMAARMPDVVKNAIEQTARSVHPNDPKAQEAYRKDATERWMKTQTGAVTH